MRNILTLFFILLSFAAEASFTKINPDNFQVEKYQTANGMTVLFYEDRSTPLVNMYQWYRAGSRHEETGKRGLAHFLEHLLFRGTSKFKPYNEYSVKWGGKVNASTYFDFTNYYEILPSSEYLEKALELEADRMRNALFSESIFEIEKNAVISERNSRFESNPRALFFEFLQKTAFSHYKPYSFSIIGSMDEIKNLTRTNVQNFYNKYYYPQNSVLVIAGNFDKNKAKGWIQKYYSSIVNKGVKIEASKTGQTEAYDLTNYEPLKPQIHVTEKVKFPLLALTYPTYSAAHKDAPVLGYLSMILGEKNILYESLVRRHRVANSVSASTFDLEKGGSFVISMTLKEGVPYKKVIKLVEQEIERFNKKGISKERMKNLKIKSYKNFLNSFQNLDNLAQQMGFFENGYGDYKALFKMEDDYQKVESEDILRVSREYLNKKRYSISVYLPQK